MDMSVPSSVLAYISGLSYIVLFLLFVWEGPIINYVAAFAASLGVFNIYIVFALAVAGGIIGDFIWYMIGRAGKSALIRKYEKSLSNQSIKRLEKYLMENPGKAITIIKITPMLPIPGLIIAGAMNVPWKKFFLYSAIVSIATAFVFTVLGYFSGELFMIMYKYVDYGIYLAGAFIVLLIILAIYIKSQIHKIAKKIEKI